MFNILPIVITFVGLAGLVVVVARRLDAIQRARRAATTQNWAEDLEQSWGRLTPYLRRAGKFLETKQRSLYEKILRSLKILNLRIDAFLSRRLEALKTQRVQIVTEEKDILRDLVEGREAERVAETKLEIAVIEDTVDGSIPLAINPESDLPFDNTQDDSE